MTPRRIVSLLAAIVLAPVLLASPAAAAPAPAPSGTVLDRSSMPLELSLPSAAAAERMTYETTGPHGQTPSTGVLYRLFTI